MRVLEHAEYFRLSYKSGYLVRDGGRCMRKGRGVDEGVLGEKDC